MSGNIFENSCKNGSWQVFYLRRNQLCLRCPILAIVCWCG